MLDAYYQTELGHLYCDDCLNVLKCMDAETVDLTVTSPPYDNLRDYHGFTFDFISIAQELFRVTKNGGVVVWVVKDSVVDGSRTLTSYKQALQFRQIGFNVFDVIIWSKPCSSLPHKNRYMDSFEYMFILSKGKPKTVNLLADRKNKYGGQTTWGNRTVREQNGELSDRGKKVVKEFGIRYNIWEIPVGFGNVTRDKIAYNHPAIFPERLVEDHITSWTNSGDVVLDPFMGSGTTGKISEMMQRRWIGIEISKEYCDIAVARMKVVKECK